MSTPQDRRIFACLVGGFLALYVFTASVDEPVHWDGYMMMQDARRLLEGGFGEDVAKQQSFYGLGHLVLQLPLVPLLDQLDPRFPLRTPLPVLLAFALPPASVAALTIGLLFLSLRRIGYAPRSALAPALALGLTSMFWVYAQTHFSDLTLALLFTTALFAALGYRGGGHAGWLALCGFAASYAVLTKVAAAPALAGFALYSLHLAWQRHRGAWPSVARDLTYFAAPATVVLSALIAYNVFRYGDPLNAGYAIDRAADYGFGTPLLVGLYGLLASSGKSVFLYAPTLVLALVGARAFARRHGPEALLAGGIVVVHLVIHARWWAWHGDWSWGPRFAVSVLPLAYLFAAPTFERLLGEGSARSGRLARGCAVALALLGFAVQLPGLVINYHAFQYVALMRTPVFEQRLYDREDWPIRDDGLQVHFIPEFSPVAGHLWMWRCISKRAELDGVLCRREPPWIGLHPGWAPSEHESIEVFHYSPWWLFAHQVGGADPYERLPRSPAPPPGWTPWLAALLLGLAGIGIGAAVREAGRSGGAERRAA
jgi:hypothetical protein